MPDDRKPPPDETSSPEPLEPEEAHAQAQLGGMLFTALDAMDGGPEAVEELHRELFGDDVGAAFEAATLAHLQDSASDAAPTRLESFVRLSFRQARDVSTPDEDAQLAALEAELEDTADGDDSEKP